MNGSSFWRTRWIVTSLVLTATAVVLVVGFGRGRLPSIVMADGSVVSVLAVNVGTNSVFSLENRWRQYLRRACPDRWEAALLGTAPISRTLRTRHDSLFLWVQNRKVDGKPTANSEWVTTLSKSSGLAPGNASLFANVACLEFRTYRRDGNRVPLKLWNGTNDVALEVINPRPTAAARWQAGPLPQTNHFSGFDIVLNPIGMHGTRGLDYLDARLFVERGTPAGSGSLEWQVTAMDPWGNWSETRSGAQDSRPMLRVTGLAGEVWRIQANGVEALSAGFVQPLTNGAAVVIPVGARAKESGVLFLAAVGTGEYRVQDEGATFVADGAAVGARAQLSLTTSARGSWQLVLLAPYPGVLCVTEGESEYKARLAGRLGRIDGLDTWTSALWEGDGKRLKFHFHSRQFPAVARKKLEVVEVFSPLPPVEYFIPSPNSPVGNTTEQNPKSP